MKDVKVVIGANFGSEGKGLMTDYFCDKAPYNRQVLNIRFNGGSQAGHTVVTPEGNKHVFSHFGAGSFNENVTTYLSSYFFVNPFAFMVELKELAKYKIKPKVLISREAKVVTTFDIFFNQLLEMSRGDKKHGSCGAGIWETQCRNQNEEYSLTMQDLYQTVPKLFEKIKSIRDEYYSKRIKEYNIDLEKYPDYKLIWNSNLFLLSYIDEIKEFMPFIELVEEDDILNRFDYQVYEGAQGLLLDCNNRNYMPNLTPSNTGLDNVIELLNKIKDKEIRKEICYVTRSYFTRHGKGKFLSETDKKNFKFKPNETTNTTNYWQDDFRYGYFDEELFKQTVKRDFQKLKGKAHLSVAVTHLDETKGKLVLKDGLKTASSLKREMNLNKLYFSFGDSRISINYR